MVFQGGLYLAMSIDRLTNLLVTIALIEMMVLTGLSVTFAELGRTVRDRQLLARALTANYLFVPATAIALLFLFDASALVAAGFLVVAVCPGAPFGPLFAGIARANVAMAAGLMVILAGSSAIVSPVLLRVLLPWVSGGEAPRIDLIAMLGALLGTQLLPLLLGLFVKHWRPQIADRLRPSLDRVCKILKSERRRTDFGHPIPDAGRHTNDGLRRNAGVAGRDVRHWLARRNDGSRQPKNDGAHYGAS